VSKFFCNHLLKKCNSKVKDQRSEFRPILINLVEDLLLVFALPDYPGAEFLLLALSNALVRDVIPASAKLRGSLAADAASPASPAPEQTYLNTTFDLLGKMCSVQARILASYAANGLKPTTAAAAEEDDDDEDNLLKCYCGLDGGGAPLFITCDRCGAVYHGTCVGVRRDNVPDEWHCDSCRLARIVERERLKHANDGERTYVDDLYALHSAYLSMISHRAECAPELKDAARIHLARWIQELGKLGGPPRDDVHDDEEEAEAARNAGPSTTASPPKRIVAELLEFWNRPGPGCEPLSDEGTNRMILSVVARASPMLLSFRQQIGFFVSMMGDVSMQSLRKLSLKAIEKVRNVYELNVEVSCVRVH